MITDWGASASWLGWRRRVDGMAQPESSNKTGGSGGGGAGGAGAGVDGAGAGAGLGAGTGGAGVVVSAGLGAANVESASRVTVSERRGRRLTGAGRGGRRAGASSGSFAARSRDAFTLGS